MGRRGSLSPARARRTASRHGLDGLVLADDALVEPLLHVDELLPARPRAGGVTGMPVQAATMLGDVVRGDLLLEQRARALERGDRRLLLGAAAPRARGGVPYLSSAARAVVGLALGLLDPDLELLELGLGLRAARRSRPSRPPSAASSRRPPRRSSASSFSSASRRAFDASSVSLRSASRSISSWMRRRSSSSSSIGIESISMRSRRRRLVDEVDRLVGQEALGDVAVATASAAATSAESVIRTPWWTS